MAHVLIVDDESDLASLVEFNLQQAGLETAVALTGESALKLARQRVPDVVLLDLMLPDISGKEVCRRLRAEPRTREVPVVMLTARGEELDRVEGFEVGADDYVTKPFSVGELIARLRALFRRASRPNESVVESFEIGDAVVNLTTHSVTRGGRVEQLSFYEVELLRLLHERVGQPVSREEILQKIWGIEAGPSNRTVDNFIVKLRKKIEASPDKPEHILTVYGFGYKLVA